MPSLLANDQVSRAKMKTQLQWSEIWIPKTLPMLIEPPMRQSLLLDLWPERQSCRVRDHNERVTDA